jgi:hypothetical protein
LKNTLAKSFLLIGGGALALAGWVSPKKTPPMPPLVAQAEFNQSSLVKADWLKRVTAKDFGISEADAARLSFIEIPQKMGTLFVVKAPPRLCGSAGCLFLGYINKRQVLSTYLIDRLPVGANTFIRAKNDKCITATSMVSYSNPKLASKVFCLKGDRYR